MFDFSADRLAELVVYVSHKCSQLKHFGRTKLYKVLYLADFTAYVRLGRPITGAAYYRWTHGPVPKAAWHALKELEESGRIRTEERPIAGPLSGAVEARPVALDEPDTTAFTEEELAIVDEAIDELAGKTAGEASEWTHRQPGWRLTPPNDRIDYRTALIPPTRIELTHAERRDGEELAEQLRLRSVA